MKTWITIAALSILCVLQYQNCSTYSDPSPFEFNSALTDSSSSSPSQVKLDSPIGILDLLETDMTLSVGGECNVGLTTPHYIEIRLQDQANQRIPVKMAPQDNTCPEKGPWAESCYIAKQFKCEHGRYSIHLPLACSAYRGQSQSTYRLLGQLVTVDSSGKETRDPKAAFDRFFQIAWSVNACP
ncbi:MAG: hypothetical protein ACAH59_12960 [Pseudobdellovibrionaceae bacterium]